MDFKLYGQPVTIIDGKITTKEALIRDLVKAAMARPPIGPWAGEPTIAKLADTYGEANVTDVRLSKAEDQETKDVIY
tara:strand:+ start:1023 stop:1253 length:231 start_codon:yes stop_codon:yes gene_type:complete